MFKAILVGSFLTVGSVCADEETPLAEKMDEVSGSLKLLRRAGDDYALCLDHIRKAQRALLECFAYTPLKLEEVPDGKEKAMAVANYRKTLAASYQTLCDLELAYLSEDLDQIDDARDKVKMSRKSGHQEFIDKD